MLSRTTQGNRLANVCNSAVFSLDHALLHPKETAQRICYAARDMCAAQRYAFWEQGMAKSQSTATQRNRQVGLYASFFKVDVARGASHISSTLKPETLAAAVTDVMTDFVTAHGRLKLEIFKHLLCEALEQRRREDAAALVAACLLQGRSPARPLQSSTAEAVI